MERTNRNRIAGGALVAAALAWGCSDGSHPRDARVEAAATGNPPPTIAALSLIPDPPLSGQSVRAVTRAQDSDGGAPSLEYTWSVRGRTLTESGPSIVLPKLRKGDRVSVSVVATDGQSRSEPRVLATAIENARPRVVDLRVDRESRDGAEYWVVDPMADDPDGDPLSFEYSWRVNGEDTGEQGDAFATGALRRGDRLTVRVVALDGEDRSAPIESAPVEVANSAPEITSRPRGLDARGEFHYAIEARDSDGDRGFRYELVQGPDGMELDSASGELRWKPRLDQTGEHRVEVAVDDRRGGRSAQVFVLPVVAREIEDAPPAAPRP
ncbi:MAG: hypothetical protein ACQGVK_08770 [Myxococcota bacterium]